MSKFKKEILLLVIFTVSLIFASTSQAQYRIVKNYNLNGVAMARYDGFGRPIIIVNPNRIPNAHMAEFVIKHEIAHHKLGHLGSNKSIWRQEYEADRWASRNSSQSARIAAANYFRRGNGLSHSFTHGTPWSRARRILNISR